MSEISETMAGRPIDDALTDHLNATYPPSGETFRRMTALCHAAINEGWMCADGAGNRRFGRVAEPDEQTNGMSVDVVALDTVVGPHHVHPTGEVGAVMPLDPDARFDKWGEGWFAYPPGSAHWPTARGGKVLVLYFLPDGKIEFTGKEPPRA